MVAPLFGARQTARLKAVRQRGFATVRQFHDDTYACWIVNRDAGWADGVSVEAELLVETGTGKLYANGAGRPETAEMVIALESGYRFRTLAVSTIAPGHLLIVNGGRAFRVDDVKREDGDDALMDVYITELVQTPIPGGP